MKVLIRKDYKKSGYKEGEIREVSDGFAANFLIPQGYAVVYNQQNKALYEQELANRAKLLEQKKLEAQELAKKIETITLTFTKAPNKNGYLTGTISVKALKKELEDKHNIKINKECFNPDTLINTFGLNNVDIELFKGVKANLKVQVNPTNN